MKIVHLTPSFYPNKGGVEKHVWEISKELIQLGHQVSVVAFDGDIVRAVKLDFNRKKKDLTIYALSPATGKHRPITFKESLNVAHLQPKKLKTWTQITQLKPIFTQANVIQIHDVGWSFLPLWPFFAQKTFITFHGWEGIYPVPKKNIYQRRFFSHWAKGVVHVGAFIQKFYGDKPDLVIYGGVDSINSNLKTQNTKIIKQVVFVGRLEKENEVLKYLEFVRLLKNQHLNLNVTWVGDGCYRPECELVGKVVGMVDQEQLASYLKQADLVLASSYLSILQSLAYGKLTLSFYSHKLKESYLKNSPMAQYLLITQRPRQAVDLIKNQQLPDLDAAVDWARKQTWQKVAQEYLGLWQAKLSRSA